MRQVKIFDTTLRDGEQAPKCSMNLDEKLKIAQALEKMNVDVMEAGFAVISQGDFQSVKTIAETIQNAVVTSLARAVPKDIDAAYEALKGAVSPRIHTFIATSPIHMEYKLKMTEADVLQRIEAMVKYAKKYVSDVEFSAEDATRSDTAFLSKAVSTAINAGATVINIPDTVGYSTPDEMYDLISRLYAHVDSLHGVELSVHCHNDLGLALANSLAAVRAGASQVECTVNGLGERAGNAALEEVLMALQTRKDYYQVECRLDTTAIHKTSMLVYDTIGMIPPLNKSIVGANAFAHEAGIHQHGVLSNRKTYEIMTPESIGLRQNSMVLGKHSGRHAVEARLKELGYDLRSDEILQLFERFKALTDRKKSINDLDLEALVKHYEVEKNELGYKLENFIVNSGNTITSHAVVKLSRDGESYEEAAIGDGPVDAVFNAIDTIVTSIDFKLEEYIIHSVTEGKDAQGEVTIKIRHGKRIFAAKGLSTDIVEASIFAYLHGINKCL